MSEKEITTIDSPIIDVKAVAVNGNGALVSSKTPPLLHSVAN